MFRQAPNPTTIPQLRCAVVAGAANNQFIDEARDGQALHDRGILSAPDFIVNAGGMINVSVEKNGIYSRERALSLTENIYHTVTDIFTPCDTGHLLSHQAAIRLAEERLNQAGSTCSLG